MGKWPVGSAVPAVGFWCTGSRARRAVVSERLVGLLGGAATVENDVTFVLRTDLYFRDVMLNPG